MTDIRMQEEAKAFTIGSFGPRWFASTDLDNLTKHKLITLGDLTKITPIEMMAVLSKVRRVRYGSSNAYVLNRVRLLLKDHDLSFKDDEQKCLACYKELTPEAERLVHNLCPSCTKKLFWHEDLQPRIQILVDEAMAKGIIAPEPKKEPKPKKPKKEREVDNGA